MSRFVFILHTDRHRANAIKAITQAPAGAKVEIKTVSRTIPQNARMWAMLTDISIQQTHCGRKYTPDQWKAIFMHACAKEMGQQFIPSLDQQTFIPYGFRSSHLTIDEMSALIEYIIAWGAQNGVVFHDQEQAA